LQQTARIRLIIADLTESTLAAIGALVQAVRQCVRIPSAQKAISAVANAKENEMDDSQNDMKETLITLTSDIVAALVSNNNVSADEVPSLITNVYGALAALGEAAPAPEKRPEPAVSIRASVKADHIVCLEDGKKLKMLKRHLMTHYNLTPDQYRQRWGLAADYPMVAPNYAERRRELAKKIGLGRKPGQKRGGRKPKAKV
jgi:predicted transcriptional regulator